MSIMTATERRRAFEKRSTRAAGHDARIATAGEAPRTGGRAFTAAALLATALACMVATQVMSSLSFAASATLIDWLLPRLP